MPFNHLDGRSENSRFLGDSGRGGGAVERKLEKKCPLGGHGAGQSEKVKGKIVFADFSKPKSNQFMPRSIESRVIGVGCLDFPGT